MNDENEPFYKNARVLLFIAVILGSLIAIMPTYSDGKFQTNLKYGLDLKGHMVAVTASGVLRSRCR